MYIHMYIEWLVPLVQLDFSTPKSGVALISAINHVNGRILQYSVIGNC